MSDLPQLASLIKSRNMIDSKIAALIGHTAQASNVGEYIASIIFRITLDDTNKRKGYDGSFNSGPLIGRTVDVQWRTRQDGLLNIRPDALPDEFLVITGPATTSSSSANPWLIESIFLFNANELLNALRERGVQISSGTSITGPLWERSEIYPIPRNIRLILSDEERKLLFLFQ